MGLAAIAAAASLAVWLAGCATPPECQRFRMGEYNILACSDDSVDRHCHKYAVKWDDGTPVDSRRIRGCYRSSRVGRRGNIIIGKSHMNVLPHEICHAEGYWSPEDCDKKFPEVGAQ